MYSVEKTRGLNFAKQFDYPLFVGILLLSAIGLFVLSSATLTMPNGSRLMTIQLVSLILGIIIALLICTIDYKDFKVLGVIFYIISIILLVAVLFIGKGETEWGSRSWIRFGSIGVQPSELAKIASVMIASVFLERMSEGNQVNKNAIKLVAYSAVPIGLVLAQPDFGTASVFIFVFFIMLFIHGLPYKYVAGTFGVALISIPIMWMFVLKGYQKKRILVFLFPELDPQDSGYHVIQSKRAIGSGQLYGKGIFQGIQTQNGIVPEKQTDFIFTVIGEELGFIGCAIVLLLIAFILIRCLYIAKNSRDVFGSYLVTGVTAMLGFHFIENVGMCIGLLPVTGIPLPFVSSGGSSMVTNYIAVGIILSVSVRRKKVIFNNTQ